MTPEIGLGQSSILEESAKIKLALLEVQDQVDRAAQAKQDALLEGIRHKMGYKPAGAVKQESLVDTRIVEKIPVVTPKALSTVLPLSNRSAKTTLQSRRAIGDILSHEDDRLIAIVGPCSIHDPRAALEYAGHVKDWRVRFGEDIEIVMRSYMEKPRTEKGWKGFIYDPKLDESDDINLGLIAARMLACQVTSSGVPIAMERLNALTPQYVNGLVAYDAIGARNTTDQKAREYASGTSSALGFKNTPDGNVLAAVQAVASARAPHAFLGTGMNGTPHQINTTGNPTAHVILRGSDTRPNFTAGDIKKTSRLLRDRGIEPSILVDLSHGNSRKLAANQKFVNQEVARQVSLGENAIRGVMIESNLVPGNQKLLPGVKLEYGQSITDECIGLDETARLLDILAAAARERRAVLARAN